MTTQVQGGKGKKKNKEKISLEEFNSFDAPVGHDVVTVKSTGGGISGAGGGTGLDWASTMAEEQITETQQIIVPTAPRAQRGPGIEYDSLPDTGPFRVSLFNLPMSIEEKEIGERIFPALDVVRIESTKNCTTVELGSKDDLYEALCKDGTSIKGRTINVLLFGQQPQNSYGSDRFGGRGGGNSSFGDRYADRDRGFGGGQRGGGVGGGVGGGPGRYGDRPGGGFNRDRDSSSSYGGGFNRGGYGPPRGGGGGGGGFGDRYNDRFNDRHSDRFSDRPPMERFSDRQNDRFSDRPVERFSERPPIERFNNRPNNNDGFPDRFGDRSEQQQQQRQKLDLKKRTTPINLDDVSRNEAIFGQAKPSSKPYEKFLEIDEKLKGKE